MFNSVFGDLTLVTNTELPIHKQWFTVACSDNSVTMSFGESKTLRINSMGLWTHSVLFWQGELDADFKLLLDTLPDSSVIYKNSKIIAIYLKNNVDYGCLRVSLRLHKNAEPVIRNLVDDKYLEKLDTLYDIYTDKMDINACLNFWVGAPLNTDLKGSSYDTKLVRKKIYNDFTAPFLEDHLAVSAEMENKMGMALNVPRVDKIRYIIVRMFKLSKELQTLDN